MASWTARATTKLPAQNRLAAASSSVGDRQSRPIVPIRLVFPRRRLRG
jgi:hypothetical protein